MQEYLKNDKLKNMKWLKFTFIVALAIIFVGTAFTAIFSSGRILAQIFKIYIFKYETCDYKSVPITREIVESRQEQLSERECYIDYNRAKKDISEGLALLIVSFPVAYFSQRVLQRSIKESVE